MPNVFFSDLLAGLASAQPGFPLARLKMVVEQEFAQIKHVLHGISLLGQCPDSINAALICRGEKCRSRLWRDFWRRVGIASR
ncbi:bifunctional aspartokinase I/homoserine dehydrogenase I [Salmonella enterica subsp. enterica serovar Hadar str. ATCC 51956]|nr:bifunctional aspartokinase I/homoserine dehydrogenase I [Salmonella enterica subsp. enterica serovar Hadar str. ATCC 51956]